MTNEPSYAKYPHCDICAGDKTAFMGSVVRIAVARIGCAWAIWADRRVTGHPWH